MVCSVQHSAAQSPVVCVSSRLKLLTLHGHLDDCPHSVWDRHLLTWDQMCCVQQLVQLVASYLLWSRGGAALDGRTFEGAVGSSPSPAVHVDPLQLSSILIPCLLLCLPSPLLPTVSSDVSSCPSVPLPLAFLLLCCVLASAGGPLPHYAHPTPPMPRPL